MAGWTEGILDNHWKKHHQRPEAALEEGALWKESRGHFPLSREEYRQSSLDTWKDAWYVGAGIRPRDQENRSFHIDDHLLQTVIGEDDVTIVTHYHYSFSETGYESLRPGETRADRWLRLRSRLKSFTDGLTDGKELHVRLPT